MKHAKLFYRKARVRRISWELDLDEDDDSLDVAGIYAGTVPLPTPQTHPDHFYRLSVPAYPALLLKPLSRRRRLPHRLSRTQLRKRLSRVGLRGRELRRTIAEILTGPRLSDHLFGRTVLGWNETALRNLLGKRAYRAVTRGVARLFVALDEMGSYVPQGLVDMFRRCRSVNSKVIPVTQTLEDFAGLPQQQVIDLQALLASRQTVFVTLPALPAPTALESTHVAETD